MVSDSGFRCAASGFRSPVSDFSDYDLRFPLSVARYDFRFLFSSLFSPVFASRFEVSDFQLAVSDFQSGPHANQNVMFISTARPTRPGQAQDEDKDKD